MARSRNIKPGFFRNEYLGMLEPLTRLLFEALWCEADREGRLEDRPLRIKAEYFPYDNCDVSTMLAQLEHSAGSFLTRYEVDGKKYIQITNFNKHQNPHIKEAPSAIPPIPQPVQATVFKGDNTNSIPASCKHRACLVLAGLIPDSLNLIPDTNIIIPPRPVWDGERETVYEQVRKSFNKFCPSFPMVREIGSVRHQDIKRLILKYERHDGGAGRFFDRLFAKAEASDFLSGRVQGSASKTFDWLIKDDNHIKVIEGHYDNERTRTRDNRTGKKQGYKGISDDLEKAFS